MSKGLKWHYFGMFGIMVVLYLVLRVAEVGVADILSDESLVDEFLVISQLIVVFYGFVYFLRFLNNN
jgi:hypothetical protein